MQSLRRLTALLLPLTLAGCLEIEEVIDLAADGSCEVVVRATGDPEDLADGAPLPLHGAWSPQDATTRAWLAGAAVDDETPLSMGARFDSVSDLPRHFEAPDALYRESGLARETSFSTQARGARLVHHFERSFPARRQRDWAVSARMDEALPDDLHAELNATLESGVPLPEARLAQVVELACRVYREVGSTQARAAVGALYTDSEAELSLAGRSRVLAEVQGAMERSIDEAYLRAVYAELLLLKREPERRPSEGLDVDARLRETLRESLSLALAREGLAQPLCNGVLERLERGFAALERNADLSDERWILRVGLPGEIVEGNYDVLEDGRAVWTRSANETFDHELRLWAVSVSE